MSRDVRRAERLARRHWTLVYLTQHPDWRGEGIVVDRRDRRATLLVPELDLEAQVHLRELPALNSSVPVAVEGVNLAELDVTLRVLVPSLVDAAISKTPSSPGEPPTNA